jgi:hypothetical protein
MFNFLKEFFRRFRKESLPELSTDYDIRNSFERNISNEVDHVKLYTVGINYSDADNFVTSRVITILSIDNRPGFHTLLKSYCHMKDAIRHFRHDRIMSYFDPESGEVLTDIILCLYAGPVAPKSVEELYSGFASIEEIFLYYQASLQEYGWHPHIAKDAQAEILGCYKIGKRGKLLRKPVFEIGFSPFRYEQIIMPDGQLMKEKLGVRSRPWFVRAGGHSLGSWRALEGALEIFADAVNVTALRQTMDYYSHI